MAIGTTLRGARLQRGLSIEQVAQDTRISARFLEALEDEAFEELPAPVYVRGFLRSYANYLKIDANPLLEELNSTGPRPIAGPDSFVGGPASQRPQRGGSNPFQRAAPPPPPAPTPEPADLTDGDGDGDEVSDSWSDADDSAEPERRPLSGRYYENEPTVDALPPAEEPFRPRRVAGVLLEREERPAGEQSSTRLLAMVGGAVIIVLFVLAAAVLLTRGGDDSTNVVAPDATATPTSRPGTVVAVGSVTASATASPSATAAARPSPGATTATTTSTVVATATAAPPTATPRPGTPVPTATATPTPEPPTPTPAPPTVTPTPRPPTATPIPNQPNGYSECSSGGDCGPSPYRVVCGPRGWFIDVGRNFTTAFGWPIHDNVIFLSQAPNVC